MLEINVYMTMCCYGSWYFMWSFEVVMFLLTTWLLKKWLKTWRSPIKKSIKVWQIH